MLFMVTLWEKNTKKNSRPCDGTIHRQTSQKNRMVEQTDSSEIE